MALLDAVSDPFAHVPVGKLVVGQSALGRASQRVGRQSIFVATCSMEAEDMT